MAAVALEPIAGRTSIVAGPANVGVVAMPNGEAVLIDAGNDDDAGRKLLRACEAAQLKIGCILNTHSNADHCGGNAFIQSRTGCRVVATAAEAAFMQMTTLEASLLWGGFPLAPLRSKFLMPKPCQVTDAITPPCSVPGLDIQAIPLPGHFLSMAGFMTSDRVFFAADTVASADILSKYHIFFLYDIAAQLESLEALARLEADWIVPSHAPPTQNIGPLVEINRAKIFEIGDVVLTICAEPSSPEKILSRVSARYGIELNHAQYVLLGSTLKSYLSWLVDRKAIASRLEGGYLLFERL